MYVSDPRFTANLDKVAPGFAQYLRDAIVAAAVREPRVTASAVAGRQVLWPTAARSRAARRGGDGVERNERSRACSRVRAGCHLE